MEYTQQEEAQAQVDIWKYVFGFTEMAVVKCAIELGIPDVLETQDGHAMTLHGLSSSLRCSPSSLHRIMRFLTYRGIFKQVPPLSVSDNQLDATTSTITYSQTPLSRLLVRNREKSMAALLLFESSPVMLAPWHCLREKALENGGPAPFDAAHGQDIWRYAKENPDHSKLLNDAMSCDARFVVSTIIDACPQVFDGIGCLVDVGGGDGTALRTLLKGRPWIRGINFDLPHVVSVAPHFEGIEHVGGDMFESVPKADAAFIMWVLHDWGDDECIRILKNCREAVAANRGKVIILEAVIDGDGDGDGPEEDKKLQDTALTLDMIMMAHTTTGKERTAEEWDFVLKEAGFSGHTLKRIPAVQSVIQAYY